MTTLFYLLAYLAIIGFVGLAFVKIKAYLDASPLHVRWELYPVPHEGDRKYAYGGSFMEEKDWWTKASHACHLDDLIALVKEVVLLQATFEHNPKLWFRSYPFHFGMYMMMGGIIIVLCATFLQFLGVPADGGFMIFVSNVISAVALVGGLCIVGGGIALIHRRRTDPSLRRMSTPEHYFNLGVFVLFGVLGLLAWIEAPSFFAVSSAFTGNLFSFNFKPIGNTFFSLHLLVGFFLMVWLPLTHMGHLFMKYFLYHDIRWSDTPTAYSDGNKKIIPDMLKFPVAWAADHIAGDGSPKTWLDVATTNPAAPKAA
jgi:nitrate reductase gamma subunit